MLVWSRRVLVTVAMAACASHAYSQSQPTPLTGKNRQFDALVERYHELGWFTGSVLVAKDGEVVFDESYGYADRELRAPFTATTRFRIGSITKQFVAAAIMLLQEDGKVRVSDTIRTHLPDYPATGDRITIHHLLTHTSGIPNYTALDDFFRMSTQPATLVDLAARFKDLDLESEPGEKYAYSNSNYIILGMIVEAASGMSWDQFLKERIFDKVGLDRTIVDTPAAIVPQRASGYSYQNGDYIRNNYYIDPSVAASAGALLSTTRDLLAWDRALYGTSILSQASLDAVFTPFKDHYAYGWVVDKIFGRKRIHHSGGINGFQAQLVRFVEDDVTIIVLANLDAAATGAIMRDLGAIAFDEAYELPKVRTVAAVRDDAVDAILGGYRFNEDVRIEITRDGSKVYAQVFRKDEGQGRLLILPETPKEWFYKATDAQITFNDEGLVFHQNGKDTPATRETDREAAPRVSTPVQIELPAARPTLGPLQ